MKMKSDKRLLAERLRAQGFSYSEITAQTGIGQSTLSGWLRHIPISAAQHARLDEKLRANRAAFPARALPLNQRRFQYARECATQAGAAIAQQLPDDPAIGELALAMLYLGEGAKCRGAVQLANMDPEILRYFIWSLKRLYSIDSKRLTLRLNLVEAARPYEEELKHWWRQRLSLEDIRFIKTQFDGRSRVAHITADYHGVCTASYNDTLLQQRILGLGRAYLDRCLGQPANEKAAE